jgi:hypothetical protein
VHTTEETALLDRGAGAEREPVDVVDLHLVRGRADPPAVHRPLALAAIALPHRATDGRGDVAAAGLRGGIRRGRRWLLGRGRLLSRVLHEPTPLCGALEKEIQAGLDDLVAGRAGVRVREGVACGFELLEEPARNRHVDARKLSVERLDRHRRGSGNDASGRWRRRVPNGCIYFGRPK